MDRYIGLFRDYSSFPQDIEESGELFANLEDAKDKLERRYQLGRSESTRPVIEDGVIVDEIDEPELHYPGVSEDAEITLYPLHVVDEGDGDQEPTTTWGECPAGTVTLTIVHEESEDDEGGMLEFDDVEAVFVE